MAIRYYLIPTLESGNRRQPSYLKGSINADGLDVVWTGMPWGGDARYLVAADVTGAQHTSLNAQQGVVALPTPDDNTLSAGEQTKAINFCTNVGLPTSWVTGTLTGRGLMKTFAGIALLLQRFSGRLGSGSALAGKLALQVKDLTAAQRDHLLAIATDFQLTRGSITADSLIGDLLIAWGQQFVARPLVIGGGTL